MLEKKIWIYHRCHTFLIDERGKVIRNFRDFILVVTVLLASPNAWAADAKAGEELFKTLCVFCHAADGGAKVGPSLTGVSQRQTAEWLDQWLKNPREMLKTDAYAQEIKANNKYNMTMPSIPAMKDDVKRADMIAYLMATF